jgi:hypothetical protein
MNGAGRASKQRRDFGSGLGKPENVVDETARPDSSHREIFGDREAGQSNAQTGAWRLIHLP